VAEPLVSVVIPTHNRPARLERLLASLRSQTLRRAEFEVVVVDDGSDPAVGQLLAAERRRGGLTLKTLRQPWPQGPAAARNAGWRAAGAPLVAFTDDDCLPVPEWLAGLLAAHRAHPGAIVQGVTQPDPTELASAGPMSHSVRVEQLGPQYETCNILYPRSVLIAVGGFDETLGPGPTAEDTDLAWRAIKAGSRTVLAPAAVVHHAIERLGARGMLRVAGRWTAAVGVIGRHPELRAMLYRRRFWNVWHYLMWRSLLALAAPPWLRRLLLVRHLIALRTRAREAGGDAGTVPFLLVYDAVECWSVARGAIRYRTLVL
jgi:glycosyltransferase involved in cell wall biosynthesis